MKHHKIKLPFVIILVSIITLGTLSYYLFTPIEKKHQPLSRHEFNKNLPEKYQKSRISADSRPSDWGWLQRVSEDRL